LNLKEALKGVKPSKRSEVKEKVANTIVSEIKKSLKSSRSPVNGEKFTKLSKTYKKYKRSQGEPGSPNLKLFGDMQDTLDTRISGNKISIGIFGDTTEKLKSYNHNVGDTLPKRQFLPDDQGEELTLRGKKGKGQFDSSILKKVRGIIDANKD